MKDRLKLVVFLTVIAFIIQAAVAFAQSEGEIAADSVISEQSVTPPPKPVIVSGEDIPNDNGHKLKLNWEYPAEWNDSIVRFEIYRADSPDGDFRRLGEAAGGIFSYLDIGSKKKDHPDYMPNDQNLYYRVDAVSKSGVTVQSEIGGPFQTSGQWFHKGKVPVLIGVVLFAIFTIYFIRSARKGKNLYIRPLAGIEAVDEAIGRATEMGKPILYVLGIGGASDIATIASFTILGRVAKKVAEYQTALTVPCYDPIVMSVAQDVVRSAYLEAGRPDQYSDDLVFFVTNAQFAYVAGINGIMVRDLPATNFYLGYFAAESLILAETGNSIGAIQIAGTDQITQIPFFVVACDYTLIGEELYAASAYLGRDPLLLGALKAEDWGKAIAMILIIVGVLATAFGWDAFREFLRVNL